MRNETPGRQQMHEELRELAKLAGTPNPAAAREPAHEFETADSSGYVDLSAYRADDPNWVEHELARAKGGGSRAIDGLAPQSMAPVALEALIAADEKLEDDAPPRRRWPLALGAIASVAAVAALAFVVTRNAPHAAKATQAVAAAPPPAVTQTVSTPEPAPAPAPETAAQAPSAAPSTASNAAPTPATPAKKPHATHASRGHAPAAVAARPAAARPAAVPASRPTKSSGDSLMDAIRASVNK
ncbi:MAG TPA: hypothetical protein VMI75_10020 [Polyangiaceae bacterium]|nr:hypothetical protein [Polyangiaceae bacterium]